MSQLRKDPVVGRWVIISTEREKTPIGLRLSKGKFEVKKCPFCPGNEKNTPHEIFALRARDSQPNDSRWKVRVIPNKFPYLRVEGQLNKKGTGMYDSMNGIGAHEIIIESPEHNVGIEDLSYDQIADVNKVFVSRIRDLKNDSRFKYILIFRNYGQRAGAVIPHPHSQLIATPITPKRVMEELKGARRYYSYRGRCVFCDMMSEESEAKERVVYENSQFLSFCPYASRFPFEIWIVPKIHASDFENIEESAMFELADVLKATLQKLKKALNEPDYNFILHTAPVRHSRNGSWATVDKEFHWHIEIMPRITYVAGFEWGTGFYKNPTPPEEAAKYLRKMDVQ